VCTSLISEKNSVIETLAKFFYSARHEIPFDSPDFSNITREKSHLLLMFGAVR
jgi:hypothetical protein